MTELVGSVDVRKRPLLRLRLAGKDDELLAIIDTAFTGELLLAEADARAWGVVVLDVEAVLELGDRSKMAANQGLVTLQWLGRSVDVTVQVTPDPIGQTSRRDGEPIGLLGTGLLNSIVLTIDFPRRSVMLKTDA